MAFAVMVGACSNAKSTNGLHPNFVEVRDRYLRTLRAFSALSNEQVKKRYNRFTVKTYGPAHGTQVEYFSPTGRCYLWYPGNTGINPCRWKIIRQETKSPWARGSNIKVPHICFSYGNNSYNPVTKHRGSSWQCKHALVMKSEANGNVTFRVPPPGFPPASASKISGDPFKLSSRQKVPFVLVKKKYSFKDLKQAL